jgi:LPS sulfotransferase NodH
VTDQWGLRPGQEAGQPAPGVEQMVQLARFAQRCEDGWRQWFAATGIQPCQVVYEDLSRDRLAVANGVSDFSASRNSMQTTFRPSATASRPTA